MIPGNAISAAAVQCGECGKVVLGLSGRGRSTFLNHGGTAPGRDDVSRYWPQRD